MAVWGAAACLLLLPLVAMQFTRDVNWTGSDFALFGTMLLVACGMYELGAWISGNTAYRAGMGLAVAGGFFLVWVHLGVGILGNDTRPVLRCDDRHAVSVDIARLRVVSVDESRDHLGVLVRRDHPHDRARVVAG